MIRHREKARGPEAQASQIPGYRAGDDFFDVASGGSTFPSSAGGTDKVRGSEGTKFELARALRLGDAGDPGVLPGLHKLFVKEL